RAPVPHDLPGSRVYLEGVLAKVGDAPLVVISPVERMHAEGNAVEEVLGPVRYRMPAGRGQGHTSHLPGGRVPDTHLPSLAAPPPSGIVHGTEDHVAAGRGAVHPVHEGHPVRRELFRTRQVRRIEEVEML